MKKPLSKDFREDFASVVESSYKNCSDQTMKTKEYIFPFVKIKSKLFGEKITSLPFLDTTSFFGNYSENDLRQAIDSFGNQEKIEIKLSLSDKNFEKLDKILLRKGFGKEITKGHMISTLSNEEKMWSGFHKHTRNDIRKAEKEGLIIKNIDSFSELKKFYRLYSQQMKDFGTPQHSFLFFERFFNDLRENFLGFNCYLKEKIIGSIIVFCGADYAYVSFNVSDPKFRNMRPNDLLYWEAIKKCISKKISRFDMGQIDLEYERGSREEGLLKFKKKWLGKEINKAQYGLNMGSSQGKKDSLKKFRKIWKRLPKVITNILGPKIASQLGN